MMYLVIIVLLAYLTHLAINVSLNLMKFSFVVDSRSKGRSTPSESADQAKAIFALMGPGSIKKRRRFRFTFAGVG